MTTINVEVLKAVYLNARKRGGGIETAIDLAWREARKSLPRARAPRGVEAVGPLNTSGRRNYRSPLGELLGVINGPYGQHSAKWPRTASSRREREEVLLAIARALGEQV